MKTPHQKTAIQLIASPGGGKGTVQKGLRERGAHFKELPFRDKMDREISGRTTLGTQIQKYIELGQLVPNELILPLVDESFGEVQESELILLDGFPRNRPQVDFAIERLGHFGFVNIITLYIDTPPYTCVRRLSKRGRDDQDRDPENIARRLEVFDFDTAPMVTYMRHNAVKLGIQYFMIDGENLQANMDAYVRMLGIGWMMEKK
jgi:adenylate kinase